MSFTLVDLLLIIIAAMTIGMFAVLARLATRMSRAAQEVEESFRYLNGRRPAIDRLLHDAEREVSEVRQMTERAGRIAADVQDIAGSARRLAAPLLTQLAAVSAGARVGLEMFQRVRQRRAQEERTNGGGGQ